MDEGLVWEQRPDLIERKDLVEGVALTLTHPDMADFGIEDLRKWQRWEMSGRIPGDLWILGEPALDVDGNLYVPDEYNNRVLKFSSCYPHPQAPCASVTALELS